MLVTPCVFLPLNHSSDKPESSDSDDSRTTLWKGCEWCSHMRHPNRPRFSQRSLSPQITAPQTHRVRSGFLLPATLCPSNVKPTPLHLANTSREIRQVRCSQGYGSRIKLSSCVRTFRTDSLMNFYQGRARY